METLKLLKVLFFFSFSFPKFKKLNISLIYEAIIVIFSVSLPMVNLNKFCKREILIQPPGEPREQHLGDVRPKSSSYTKFHKRQNDRKGRYTMANFWKNWKKVKNEVTGTEKRRIWLIYLKTFHNFTFLGPVTSILIFLQFSQKCARLYRPFRSFRLLWKFL